MDCLFVYLSLLHHGCCIILASCHYWYSTRHWSYSLEQHGCIGALNQVGGSAGNHQKTLFYSIDILTIAIETSNV